MFNLNARYIEMHLDRLNDELISETYGKQEESDPKTDSKKEKTIKD